MKVVKMKGAKITTLQAKAVQEHPLVNRTGYRLIIEISPATIMIHCKNCQWKEPRLYSYVSKQRCIVLLIDEGLGAEVHGEAKLGELPRLGFRLTEVFLVHGGGRVGG